MEPNTVWFLTAYAIGTVFGWAVGKYSNARGIAEMTVNTLIDQGYLKTRKNKSGETEILKHNEE